MSDWSYYALEGKPARVKMDKGTPLAAEIYKLGTGFVHGPLLTIMGEGRPLSQREFDALILGLVKKSGT